MGRRGIHPRDTERWVFNRLADAYRHRPGYPDALAARLTVLAGPGGRVADLGAGTGQLALPLAAQGLRVAAVEPAERMLDALRSQALARGLAIEPVHAAAEDTGLPPASCSLLLLADAIQWVDPERAGRELARLCAPGGVCAVVEADLADTPFLSALQARIAAANPRARIERPRPVAQVLSLAVPGGAVCTEAFLQEEALGPAALEGTLRSLSFVGPALGEVEVQRLVDDAHALARAHGGAGWKRLIRLSWTRRGAAPRE